MCRAFCLMLMLSVLAFTSSAQLINCSPDATGGKETACGERSLRQLIESDVIQEKFDELDALAEKYQRENSRTRGGGWRLWDFYQTISHDQPNDDKEGAKYLVHLQHWVQQRPDSITAHLVLAAGYFRWGFSAPALDFYTRKERSKMALSELSAAEHTNKMCAQWYWMAIQIGLGQGWPPARIREIFDDGVRFSPEYIYIYTRYLQYVWANGSKGGDLPIDAPHGSPSSDFFGNDVPQMGHPKEVAGLAKSSADQIGGADGDILYFQIAASLLTTWHRSRAVSFDDGFPVQELNWSRIQRGCHALSIRFGNSERTLNQMAVMAWKYKDVEMAHRVFAIIGDKFSVEVWGDKKRFDQAFKWSGAQVSEPTPNAP